MTRTQRIRHLSPYLDSVQAGLSPATSHPDYVAIVPEWFWSEDDPRAPFGSDDGRYALRTLEGNFFQGGDDERVPGCVANLIADWALVPELIWESPLDEIRVWLAADENHVRFLRREIDAYIAAACGQFKISGWIHPALRSWAERALMLLEHVLTPREQRALGVAPEDFDEKIAAIRQVILAAPEPPKKTQPRTFDASMVDPGVRSLGMKATLMPDGELAKLEGLESLVMNGGTAERIDLRGCHGLRDLHISHVRGLVEIVGIEELTTLELLDLYALPRVQAMPSLEGLTRLWRLEIGSMKGLTGGLAPFLAAPNLREIQLASTLILAPGDAELLRDHPRVVGFSWWDSKGTPAADVRDLFDTAGRRPALMREDGRPPEHEVPLQRVEELAPAHMVQITVACRGYRGGDGGVRPLSGLGDVLLDGEHDYGPGLRQIRITLCQGTRRPDRTRIKLQQAKGVLSIEQPSDLPEERFHQADASPALFERGAREVVAALEAAQARVAEEIPEFAFDALLERCREVSGRLPATPEEIDALIEQAELRARTLRVAMNRLRERTNREGR